MAPLAKSKWSERRRTVHCRSSVAGKPRVSLGRFFGRTRFDHGTHVSRSAKRRVSSESAKRLSQRNVRSINSR